METVTRGLRHERPRAEQMRERAPAIDVGDQQRRRIGVHDDSIVHEVDEIDLGRASCAFDQHELVARGQLVEGLRRGGPEVFAAPRHGSALRSWRTRPRTTTWLRVSASGLSSTGFIATWGSSRAATACSHWATPISPPSTTRALFDMFWALKGTTSTPSRWNQRAKAVTSRLLPADDVHPSTINGRNEFATPEAYDRAHPPLPLGSTPVLLVFDAVDSVYERQQNADRGCLVAFRALIVQRSRCEPGAVPQL